MKSLMVQGTCSGAGKSLLVAGLCRIFSDLGVRVAPFKSQNMALNSFATPDGAEIGRAQALQAEASRVLPTSDMNPVLLKATGDSASQVIVHGHAVGNMTAKKYYTYRDEAWRAVEQSLERLAATYELIVVEGAGSPAEINLSDVEIVNMRVARHLNCPVLLVGDIDRGGVFASLYGTVALTGNDARMIKGFVINKFRGDRDILAPGMDMLFDRTGIPTLGVLPYVREIGLEDEDGLSLPGRKRSGAAGGLRVVAIRVDYISNFTDLLPFAYEPDVEVIFTDTPEHIEDADLIILPGTKNTIKDLMLLRSRGIEDAIKRAAAKGARVVGLCGGYQMLGRTISDPTGVEGPAGTERGIGLLDVDTVLQGRKVVTQATASTELFGGCAGIVGYEIHMGATTGNTGAFVLSHEGDDVPDGSAKGTVWGTYLHGIFDNDEFRSRVLNPIRRGKGLRVPEEPVRFRALRDRAIDAWADHLRANLDIEFIKGLLS